jgi:hypothetical protein
MDIITKSWSLSSQSASLMQAENSLGELRIQSPKMAKSLAMFARPLQKILSSMARGQARMEWKRWIADIHQAEKKAKFGLILTEAIEAYTTRDLLLMVNTHVFGSTTVFEPAEKSGEDKLTATWRKGTNGDSGAYRVSGAGRSMQLRAGKGHWHVEVQDEDSGKLDREIASWPRMSEWRKVDQKMDIKTGKGISFTATKLNRASFTLKNGKVVDSLIGGGDQYHVEGASDPLWAFLLYTARVAESVALGPFAVIGVLFQARDLISNLKKLTGKFSQRDGKEVERLTKLNTERFKKDRPNLDKKRLKESYQEPKGPKGKTATPTGRKSLGGQKGVLDEEIKETLKKAQTSSKEERQLLHAKAATLLKQALRSSDINPEDGVDRESQSQYDGEEQVQLDIQRKLKELEDMEDPKEKEERERHNEIMDQIFEKTGKKKRPKSKKQ